MVVVRRGKKITLTRIIVPTDTTLSYNNPRINHAYIVTHTNHNMCNIHNKTKSPTNMAGILSTYLKITYTRSYLFGLLLLEWYLRS